MNRRTDHTSLVEEGSPLLRSKDILPQVLLLEDGRNAEIGRQSSYVYVRIGNLTAAQVTVTDAFLLSEALRRMARKVRKAQQGVRS